MFTCILCSALKEEGLVSSIGVSHESTALATLCYLSFDLTPEGAAQPSRVVDLTKQYIDVLREVLAGTGSCVAYRLFFVD